MTISFVRLDPTGDDRDGLVDFMTRNEFPFHVRTCLTSEQVGASIAEGAFRDEDNDSFWIEHDELGRIGFFRLEDLTDGAPLFDLRLDGAFRGRGLGVPILRAAADHVFGTMPAVNRFEGQTREDNIAMRKTFLRAGWVKEAHYRQGWPVEGGAPVASVAYGILRQDWESGGTSTFDWDDLGD
ncbi:GNAT family N-acetyltransferase [Ornithinicoccus hortensis]|uniref:GNAT family N-acetyltransferase n=1 Tax=Ornithinicoccus hortensis TaxID=82346 RepID=UPI0011536F06|nr:GNAT family protein [Ornithinicoccus hortensis]